MKKKKKCLPKTIHNDDDDEAISYDILLERIYKCITTDNPQDKTPYRRLRLPHPDIGRLGSTRTLWRNYDKVYMLLNRDSDHLLSFFKNELGTMISINKDNQMVVQGRYESKYFESLISKYINSYVTCLNCKSTDTTLARDSASRLVFMTCSTCRSVIPITDGYHAVVSKKERRQKADIKN